MSTHYANLTNGVICAPANANLTRIPSTWCEQKRWSKVLYGAGADLLATLASGYTCVVHDQSEKQRATRAQWQGLSWLRYACSMAWQLGEPVEYSRNGMDVTGYWRGLWLGLPAADRSWLEYFGDIAQQHGTKSVELEACSCERVEWTYGDGKSLLRRI